MKRKLFILGGLLAIGALALFALPQHVDGAISGSSHDFSGAAWNPGGEICQPCHIPHGSTSTTTGAPLWNHGETTATYSLYTGFGSMDATTGQPDGASKLCLSCHDGTVALDAFGGAPGGAATISGAALFGTDLTNDHPISFTYNAALATSDGQLHDPTTELSGLPGGGTIQGDMLFNNSVECASCHDVHNYAGNSKMLVKPNTGSALCLTCHNK